MNKQIEQQIKKALDVVRPHLQMDGGNVDFVSFNDKSGELKVKLQGACAGCPMSQMTLESGIARVVMEKVSAVKKVIAI